MRAKILIVDDSLTVRMDLMEILEAEGLPAVACATGEEARKALAKAHYPLVILDVLLPDMDGIELLKEIRERPDAADTAIMLLSTEAEVRDRIRGLSTGADDYIGKPYEPRYLIARARELLHRDSAAVRNLILVIDDSITFRETLKTALEEASYRVAAAGTGEEGLRIAADLRPAALVVDGMLPGIDGATVIRHIRLDVALRSTPCLLLTASEDKGAEVRALDAGADAFVRKDADIPILLAKLSAILRSAGARNGGDATATLLGPKKILAVDDSETYLHELASMLHGNGYEVILARSGEEALDLLAVQAVDCILLDVLMPGIGGQETCRRVKSVPVTRDIPVVMLTALEDQEALILGLGAGADDFIAKSSDFDVLHARVLAQLRRKQFQDENRRIQEQRKVTEGQLYQAQKMEAVGQLTGGLAHDFNNLLTIIIASLDGLEGDVADRPKAAQLVQSALKASLQGATLTRQLLAFSRKQQLEVRVIDLNELVVGTTALLRRTLGEAIEVKTAFSQDLWLTEVDPAQVESALVNMAINARDAMPKGGILTIETANKHLDEAYAAENPGTIAGDYVMLAITDSGTGIPASIISRVFDPFFTTKEVGKGTGLGLSMVYGFIKQSGGHVKIYSEEGHGTTIRLYLPKALSTEKHEVKASNPGKEAERANHEVILVVDDNEDVREVVVEQLQRLGYILLEAENAARAMEILDGGTPIDLLFTDIVMPGGMSGLDLVYKARESRPQLAVLCTSGFTEVSIQQTALQGQDIRLISKPYRLQELAIKIREALG